jgi:hypothetical protein
MSTKTEKQAGEKPKRKLGHLGIILIIAALAVAALIAIALLRHFGAKPPATPLEALQKHIFSAQTQSKITASLAQDAAPDNVIIFLSICNTKERAAVVKGRGPDLKSAWENAADKAAEIIAERNYNVIWAKADIVNSAKEIATVDLNKEIEQTYYQYFFRKGLAFDKNFDTAFLEAEVNGNKMITYYTESQLANAQVDYEALILNLNNINHYLKNYYGLPALADIPPKITTFTTLGFFCDEEGAVYDLYTQGLDTGRRTLDIADAKMVEMAITNASRFLYNWVQPDGKFTYGYFPIFDNEITSYNILRHSGSIWSLINLYRMTGDNELLPNLKAAIAYLLEGFIEYKDAETAYVVERKADEIKLGGNALAIIMLTEYMDVFATDEYVGLVGDLANGIVELENLRTGSYYHVLNFPDFSRKEEYRTVYYDGEATFALARAYACTQKPEYLAAAQAAVENFIALDYTRYRDHWVAYALNEVTKYAPEPRYYEFALQNVAKNLDRIYNQETAYHTYLELLMVGWQTYQRLLESGLEVAYVQELDVQYFAETIYKRVFHMFNSYFYPEIAMYMKRPNKALNAFFVRHDNFRVRIDDIQHFIGGYYYYAVYYDNIRPYLSAEFLASLNSGGLNSSSSDREGGIIDE